MWQAYILPLVLKGNLTVSALTSSPGTDGGRVSILGTLPLEASLSLGGSDCVRGASLASAPGLLLLEEDHWHLPCHCASHRPHDMTNDD